MKNDVILVIGANGLVGSEVVRLLKEEGKRVKAATSRPPKSKDEVHLNLATGEGLQAAFEGVDRAFLLSPPGYADQHRILSPLIQEAKRRGLNKVVLMTAMGANAVESTPFRRAEIELEKSGLNYNIVRPNWFLQNFNTFWIQGILAKQKISLPAGNAKTSFIDAKDISAVIAKLLTSDEFDNQAFDLTGSEALDHNQAAKEISLVSGKSISYSDAQPQDFKKELLSAGLPADYSEFLVTIFGFLKAGYAERTTTSVTEILGRQPRSLKQYANETKQAWI